MSMIKNASRCPNSGAIIFHDRNGHREAFARKTLAKQQRELHSKKDHRINELSSKIDRLEAMINALIDQTPKAD